MNGPRYTPTGLLIIGRCAKCHGEFVGKHPDRWDCPRWLRVTVGKPRVLCGGRLELYDLPEGTPERKEPSR